MPARLASLGGGRGLVAMLKRVVVLLIGNVVVLCVAAELTALGVYYFQHGWLFYLNPYRTTFQPLGATASGGALTDVGLHPYFGPVHRAGLPVEIPASMASGGVAVQTAIVTNNFGFASAHAYPYRKRSDREFVVGIFGGSVGAWFCQLGAPRLAQSFSRRPFFRGKTIIPLCFSHEGYKQPQQALLLTYFLSVGQQFDLVVNIDGFNEVALSKVNDEAGLDMSMPSAMHLEGLRNLIDGATMTSEKLQSLAAIEGHRQRMNTVAARLNRTWSAAMFVVLEGYYRVVEGRYQAERVTFAALPSAATQGSAVHVTPRIDRGEPGRFFDDVAQLWLRSSDVMRDALAKQGTAYVHVLQPNQYFSQRRFTEEERKVAINPASPFKPGAELGYPKLLAALGGSVTGRGSPVFDATRLFDDERAPVYVDDCCHYSLRGNELLADFVVRSVLSVRPNW
jgi:hypothetical protein